MSNPAWMSPVRTKRQFENVVETAAIGEDKADIPLIVRFYRV
jgi:hypothetical protein